jgi:MFS family permease
MPNPLSRFNSGLHTFLIIWVGQFLSRVGTAMTRFALLIWAYDQTGAATTVALLGFFGFLPFVLLSPVAGVWVDRLDRRRVMLLADLGAGLITAALLALYFAGALALWHLYAAELLTAALEAFQGPAYTAATSTLLGKEQYGRASGLRSMAEDGARVLAPFLAGLLIVWVGVPGVLMIDVATFLVAVVTLSIVVVPGIHAARAGQERDFWREMRVGFAYLRRRPGLLGMTLQFTGVNFCAALTYYGVMPAMILARTGGNEVVLGIVEGALGAAGVAGGVLMAVWGGPRRKIHGVLGATALSFLLGDFLFAVGQDVWAWVVAAVAAAIFIPIILGSRQAIWQAKVAPEVQGRVFSVDSMLRLSLNPLGYLLAGFLADGLLEPAMQPDGALASLFGPLVGTGPGAGMALMFVGTAVLGCLISLSGYLVPAVRNIESELPDHDSRPSTAGAMAD